MSGSRSGRKKWNLLCMNPAHLLICPIDPENSCLKIIHITLVGMLPTPGWITASCFKGDFFITQFIIGTRTSSDHISVTLKVKLHLKLKNDGDEFQRNQSPNVFLLQSRGGTITYPSRRHTGQVASRSQSLKCKWFNKIYKYLFKIPNKQTK